VIEPVSGAVRVTSMHTSAGLLAACFAAAAVIAPPAPSAAPPTVQPRVQLAADAVPLGGLLTSFVGNQAIYCSLICPLAVQTFATAAATATQAPVVLMTGLQSGDVVKAIGAAAASVTGPTDAAAAATILADGSIVAPRAFNALEVGVVGLLNVIPAAAGGVPGVVAALQTARQDTFDALNAPLVPNPPSTAAPRGLVQVTVISALNVVAAVVFPAFNEVLGATTRIPDAIAQELAATGDPVRAAGAGVAEAVDTGRAAVTVVADAVQKAVTDVQTAAEPATVRKSSAATTSAKADPPKADPPKASTSRPTSRPHPVRDAADKLRKLASADAKHEAKQKHSDDHGSDSPSVGDG
jgi:hypothetical protein